MFNETIEVSVTYGSTIKFFLEMVGISRERELRAKTFGLNDAEKAEKEYQNNVDILIELSKEMPTGLFPAQPETVALEDKTVYAESFKKPADAIKSFFFSEKTPVKERIAFYAVNGYFTRLLPSESFF